MAKFTKEVCRKPSDYTGGSVGYGSTLTLDMWDEVQKEISDLKERIIDLEYEVRQLSGSVEDLKYR